MVFAARRKKHRTKERTKTKELKERTKTKEKKERMKERNEEKVLFFSNIICICHINALIEYFVSLRYPLLSSH
jgi:hypothetical protein